YRPDSERNLKILSLYYLGLHPWDIAKVLHINPGLVSGYLTKLKKRGLLEKKSKRLYQLSEEGRKWIKAIEEERSPVQEIPLSEVKEALEEAKGNVVEASRILGITREKLRGIVRRNPHLQKEIEELRKKGIGYVKAVREYMSDSPIFDVEEFKDKYNIHYYYHLRRICRKREISFTELLAQITGYSSEEIKVIEKLRLRELERRSGQRKKKRKKIFFQQKEKNFSPQRSNPPIKQSPERKKRPISLSQKELEEIKREIKRVVREEKEPSYFVRILIQRLDTEKAILSVLIDWLKELMKEGGSICEEKMERDIPKILYILERFRVVRMQRLKIRRGEFKKWLVSLSPETARRVLMHFWYLYDPEMSYKEIQMRIKKKGFKNYEKGVLKVLKGRPFVVLHRYLINDVEESLREEGEKREIKEQALREV
ncbi:MAG: hypothetical protein DRP75_04535, partial [Candidatus Omnitrophota bacterium]